MQNVLLQLLGILMVPLIPTWRRMMVFETRLRGKPYLCVCETDEEKISITLKDMNGNPIDFSPTEQELLWIVEECSVAHYANQRGIDY